MAEPVPCPWAESSPLMREYHDKEWGKPAHDDAIHFEFLILEGAQAGLSWQTVLNRREEYRKAYDGFDPARVALYGESDQARLLASGIIKNRRKVEASITNARLFLDIQKEFGSFDRYIWGFTEGKPIVNAPQTLQDIPAETDLSRRISADLKKRGFKFVGPTIIYAHLQAVGIVNDHLVSCPCRTSH